MNKNIAPALADETRFKEKHVVESPGNTSYFVNPAGGSDTHSGLERDQAWQTFAPVNRLTLMPGDKVKVIAPGSFDQTLVINGSGSKDAPIEIHFAPGRYDLFPAKALRRKYHISNTNDDPDGEKAIGILLDGAKHIQLSGPGAALVYRGKMIEVCIDSSENIEISGLHFDYHRPTVSEFRVTAIEKDHVDIEVHKDSTYEIEDGQITWIGEGWQYQSGLAQELDLETNEVWRRRDPLKGLRLEEITPLHIRAKGEHDLKPGRVYQIRETRRDYAGVFTRRSKDIVWKHVTFHYLHGMGLVNQFSQNLTFDSVSIAPDKTSGRTCAGWADGIQASGCRGTLVITNCTFSGLHDDAINIHGTHLRVVQKISETQIKVRFMHGQTYGFVAFNPGDEMSFVRWDSLRTYGPNRIKTTALLDPKEMLLTLEHPMPADINEDDAVENISWTPEVVITGCNVMRIPTRGFLITTRRKVVVKENEFRQTRGSAILLENDAKGWYESGPVRDMTICGNRFFNCGEPVININPQNSVANNAVHQNISIEGNHFALRNKLAVAGHSTKGLIVRDNAIYSDKTRDDNQSIRTSDCTDVCIEKNRYLSRSQWVNKTGQGV